MNKQLVDMMIYLFNAWGYDTSGQRLKIYCEAFKDIDLDVLGVAVRRCVDNYKFLPSIAEIKEELREIKGQVTGDRQLDWDEAWKEIQSKMFSVGPYQKPEWSTPEIANVVKSIGWVQLCETPTDQMGALRAQTKVMYELGKKRETSKTQTKNILEGKTGFESIGSQIQILKGAKE